MAEQTWTSLQQSCAIAMGRLPSPVPATPTYDTLFLAQFPLATSYAEARIYHEIPFLASYAENTSVSTMAGVRTIGLPQTLVTLEQIRLVVPASTSLPAGAMVPFDRVTLDFIDRYWPSEGMTVAPSLTSQYGRYWAMVDNHTVALAPTPDAVYQVKAGGLYQPDPISASNPVTYLSTNYPDLLQAAVCVFLAGALNRNYGAQADETGQAMSWELQFTKLLAPARAEEMRRRGMVPDMPMPAAPAARTA